MSRAVMVGTNAYPYLIRYWFELFTRFWQDEVDRVYIVVSNPEHPTSWNYIKSILNAHPKVTVYETNSDWPASINTIAPTIKEDYILIMHDDTFVYKKGVIDTHFKIVEADEKQIIAPITRTFNPAYLIQELMFKKWPDQLPINPDGYSFYANFLFLSRALFQQTNMKFDGWQVKLNEHCEILNWTPRTTEFYADTDFKLFLELLNAGGIFHPIPKNEFAHIFNNKNPLADLRKMQKNKESVFAGEAGWVHLQTMAYHIYGLYFDYGQRKLLEIARGGKVLRRFYNEKCFFNDKLYKNKMMIRLAWIYEFMDACNYGGIYRYHAYARSELRYIEKTVKLDHTKIMNYKKIFHELIWQER